MTITRTVEKPHSKRGVNAVPGWWIGLDEARELSKCQEGAEWWKAALDGRTVEVRQYVEDGPEDAPIWMYHNFDMYLGQWKSGLECGFGVTYNHNPHKYRGLVCVGSHKDGYVHGLANSGWSTASKTWKSNFFPGSPIRERILVGGTMRKISRPFNFRGKFVKSQKNDKNGIAVLKDGTMRCGTWRDNVVCGDWWTSHSLKNESHHELRTMIPVVDKSSFGKATKRKLRTKIGCKLQRIPKSIGDDEDKKMPASSPRKYQRDVQCLSSDDGDEDDEMNSIKSPGDGDRKFNLDDFDSDGNDKGNRHAKRTVDRLLNDTSPDPRSNGAQSSSRHKLMRTEKCTENEVIKSLAVWLDNDVMKQFKVPASEMEEYAKGLYELGADSKEAIVEFLSPDDIKELGMKVFHKRAFLQWLESNKT